MISFARIPAGRSLSVAAASKNIGSISLFSSPAAVSKKPSPDKNNYQHFNFPTTLLPIKPSSGTMIENGVLKIAMQDLKKKQDEISYLQWLMDKMKIATLPSSVPSNVSTSQHTFQVMNRNARKAKRANHGKRPCSRDRRRWKIKKWANTSRRG
jgi:hypothetical protein